jgi:hypothetical protein
VGWGKKCLEYLPDSDGFKNFAGSTAKLWVWQFFELQEKNYG